MSEAELERIVVEWFDDAELALFADEMKAWADTSITAASDIWSVDE